MDKTTVDRRVWSRVLFTALMLQALTPDAYDLTLIIHDRPPGPVVILMGILDPEREDERDPWRAIHGEPATASCPGRSAPGEGPAAPPTDNVMQPLWPEQGLSRNLDRPGGLTLQRGSDWSSLPVDPARGSQGDRSAARSTPGNDVSLSTCRMTC
jgi:hypothetical protein